MLHVKLDFFYEGTEYIETKLVIKKKDFDQLSAKIDEIYKICEKIDDKKLPKIVSRVILQKLLLCY